MNFSPYALPVIFLLLLTSCGTRYEGKHLFILSGQSNMGRLDPADTFTPLVAEAFGAEDVIVVKSAYGGQPIRRWYRDWSGPAGTVSPTGADLYDSLLLVVNAAVHEVQIATVTFVWMQGERDARMGWGTQYQKSLEGLYPQLKEDLGRTEMNFVIGRLSDFDLNNERYPDWTVVREAQLAVAKSNDAFTWVDTDDLNDGLDNRGNMVENDLHMSAEGYLTLGRRFAEQAIFLIEN